MEAASLPAEAGFQLHEPPVIDDERAIELLDGIPDPPDYRQLDLIENPFDIFGPWAHKQYLDKYSWKDEPRRAHRGMAGHSTIASCASNLEPSATPNTTGSSGVSYN